MFGNNIYIYYPKDTIRNVRAVKNLLVAILLQDHSMDGDWRKDDK